MVDDGLFPQQHFLKESKGKHYKKEDGPQIVIIFKKGVHKDALPKLFKYVEGYQNAGNDFAGKTKLKNMNCQVCMWGGECITPFGGINSL